MTENLFSDVTGIILAGGRSSRMGQRKAVLEIQGVPIIDRVASVLRSLFHENIVVVNEAGLHAEIGCEVVIDQYPGGGSLVGLYTGLMNIRTDYAFCVACDMPFLNASLVRYLAHERGDEDVVLPLSDQGPEPLHAIYRKTCVPQMQQQISQGQLAIHKLFERLNVKTVPTQRLRMYDPDLLSLANCNTPEEYNRLRGIADMNPAAASLSV